ncbi:MAG TPA: cytochrome c peroxidase, partial [Kofleriaceae bacterium]|nr:cytochrome c peroxidase [Kofleriaceae bacterium]
MTSLLLVMACSTSTPVPTKEQLGRLVFEDQDMSTPPGQACADCHAAKAAFRDPETSHAESMGVVPGRFGSRNSPSLFYVGFVPPLHQQPGLGYVGGVFWDGRAASLEDQVAGPLLNPIEMNNPDKAAVVAHLRAASYAGAFRELFGSRVLDDDATAFTALTTVLGAYERSSELAPFSSKYDRYLAGKAALDVAEARGLAIFEDPARGDCARCHPSRPGPNGEPPLFTTFAYANLGIPRYENNKFYLANPDFVDHGLATTVTKPSEDGKFRIPTLRNVARTAPYGHNGYFANLPYALEFVANREAGSYDVSTCSRTGTEPTRCAWP